MAATIPDDVSSLSESLGPGTGGRESPVVDVAPVHQAAMRRLDVTSSGPPSPASPLISMPMAALAGMKKLTSRGAAAGKKQKQATAVLRWRRYYMLPVAEAVADVVAEEVHQPGWLDRLNATALSQAGQERFARRVHERGLRCGTRGLEPAVALTGPPSERPRPLRRGDAPFGDDRHSRERSYAVLLFLLRHLPRAYVEGGWHTLLSRTKGTGTVLGNALHVLASKTVRTARGQVRALAGELPGAGGGGAEEEKDEDEEDEADEARVQRAAAEEEEDDEDLDLDSSDDDSGSDAGNVLRQAHRDRRRKARHRAKHPLPETPDKPRAAAAPRRRNPLAKDAVVGPVSVAGQPGHVGIAWASPHLAGEPDTRFFVGRDDYGVRPAAGQEEEEDDDEPRASLAARGSPARRLRAPSAAARSAPVRSPHRSARPPSSAPEPAPAAVSSTLRLRQLLDRPLLSAGDRAALGALLGLPSHRVARAEEDAVYAVGLDRARSASGDDAAWKRRAVELLSSRAGDLSLPVEVRLAAGRAASTREGIESTAEVLRRSDAPLAANAQAQAVSSHFKRLVQEWSATEAGGTGSGDLLAEVAARVTRQLAALANIDVPPASSSSSSSSSSSAAAGAGPGLVGADYAPRPPAGSRLAAAISVSRRIADEARVAPAAAPMRLGDTDAFASQGSARDLSLAGVGRASGIGTAAAEHAFAAALTYDPLVLAWFGPDPSPTEVRTALLGVPFGGQKALELLFGLFELCGSISPVCFDEASLRRVVLSVEPSRRILPRREAVAATMERLYTALGALFDSAARKRPVPPHAPTPQQLRTRAEAGLTEPPPSIVVRPPKRGREADAPAPALSDEDLFDGALPPATRAPAMTIGAVAKAVADAAPAPRAAPAPAPTGAAAITAAMAAAQEVSVDLLPAPRCRVPSSLASDTTATTVLPAHIVAEIPPASRRTAKAALTLLGQPAVVVARVPAHVLRWRARLRITDDVVYRHHAGATEADLARHRVRSVLGAVRRPLFRQSAEGKDGSASAVKRARLATPAHSAKAALEAAEREEGAALMPGNDGVSAALREAVAEAEAGEASRDELAQQGMTRLPKTVVTVRSMGFGSGSRGQKRAERRKLEGAEAGLKHGLVFLVDWCDAELNPGAEEEEAEEEKADGEQDKSGDQGEGAKAAGPATQTWLDWGTLAVLAPLQLNTYLYDFLLEEAPDGEDEAVIALPPCDFDTAAVRSAAAVAEEGHGPAV